MFTNAWRRICRLWGLYLGRSFFLTLDENVTVPRLSGVNSSLPLHTLLAGSWASLLELVGLICENLYVCPAVIMYMFKMAYNSSCYRNRNQCTMVQINSLGDRLHQWYIHLDPQLYYKKDGPPSVAVMQYAYPDVTKLETTILS